MLISMRGSMLDELEEKIVEVTLDPKPPRSFGLLGLPMHRAIYRQTEANAVFHGHGRFSIMNPSPLRPHTSPR